MYNNLISKDILVNFIISELDSDHGFFQKQLGHFLNHLDEFKTAGQDPAQLGKSAHKIRSGCYCFGAVKLGEGMQQIELMETLKELKANDELFEQTAALIEPTVAEIKKISAEYFRGVKKSA